MEDHALIGSLTAKLQALEDTVVQLRHTVNRQQELLDGRQRQADTAREILARAGAMPARPVAPASHVRPRNPHGWGVIKGGAAALIPLWLVLKMHRHAAAAALSAVTLAGATGLAVTANIANAPGRALVTPAPPHRRRTAHPHRQAASAPGPSPVTTNAVDPDRDRRRRRASASATPLRTPPASPLPSPAPTDPDPSPGPSVTPSPSPSGLQAVRAGPLAGPYPATIVNRARAWPLLAGASPAALAFSHVTAAR